MKKSWIVLGLTLVLCGCSYGGNGADKEITPIPIDVPTVIAEPEPTKSPEPTPEAAVLGEVPEELKKEMLTIDSEHFGSEAFCSFIREKLDLDKDGVLSGEERWNVTELYLGLENPDQVQTPFDGVVRGFSYFPNLKEIHGCSAYEIEIKNHSALERFTTTECWLDEVRIEDCPNLTTVNCYGTFGKSRFLIRNCEKLLQFETVEGYNESLTFVNTPNVVVVPSAVGELDMEGANFLENSDVFPLNLLLEQKGAVNDGDKLEYAIGNTHIIWNGVKEDNFCLSKDLPLQFITEKDIDCFTYEVFEGNEPDYDEAGNRRYYICITTKGDEAGKESLPIYLPDAPKVENCYVRVNQVEDIMLHRYSPNNGVSFEVKMNFTLLYRDGENEIEVGTLGTKKQSWVIDRDGNAAMRE